MLSRLGFATLRQARTQMVMRQPAMLYPTQRMSLLKDLGLDHDALVAREQAGADKQAGQVDLWKQQAESTKNALVLRDLDLLASSRRRNFRERWDFAVEINL